MMNVVLSLSVGLLGAGIQEKIKDKMAMQVFKKLNDENFDAIFKKSLKETCQIFIDGNNLPSNINPEILKSIAEAEDIFLSMIFPNNGDLSVEQYSEKECFDIIKQSLKNFIKIKLNEEIEDIFYDSWIEKFKEIYQRNFKQSNIINDIHFRKFMVDSQGYMLENMASKSDIAEIKNILSNSDNSNNIVNINISEISFTNNEIQTRVKDFIKNKEYKSCISYINEQVKNQDKTKSELLAQKGFCEFNIQDYKSAEKSYIEAYELDKSNDKNISNIIKCLINTNQFDKINNYICKYNDKTSSLYYESKFYELLYANNDIDNATKLLEEQKDNIPNYNLNKSTLLMRAKAPYSECIKYMNLSIEENPDNKFAKYELLRLLYGEIFENDRIQFSIGVRRNEEIEINPVFNNNIYIDKVNYLIVEIENILNQNNDIPEDYSLSLKIMLTVLYAQQCKLDDMDRYITEIISKYKELNNDFDRNNLCILLLMKKEYDKAYEIYENHLEKDNQDINLTVILNFALKKYEVCLELIDKYDLQNYDLLLIHSIYKLKAWAESSEYFKNNFNKYNINTKMLILDYFYENKDYDFCLANYTDIANEIINNDIKIPQEIICVLTHNLDLLKQKTLADKLIAFYWNMDPNPAKNFITGLNYARQMYNKGKYSECLETLKVLSEFNENNPDIQELYMLIDIANGAYSSAIEKFEKGDNTNIRLVPHIAMAYIYDKKYDKAENALEQLKDCNELKDKYYIIKNIIYFQTSEYDKLIDNMIEAKNTYPDNVDFDKQIFDMCMHIPKDAKIPSKFGILYNQALKNLTDKNVITQIQVSENNLDALSKFMQEQNKSNNNEARLENFNKIYKAYNNFQFPIELLYKVTSNRNRIEVFSSLLQSKQEKVNINICDANLTKIEIENLKNSERVLIGIESLILLNELELDLKVKGTLNIHISNYTKLEIEQFLLEENAKSERKGVLGTDEAGNLRYTEYLEEYKKYLPFLNLVCETYPKLERNSASKKGINLIKEAENFQTDDLFRDAIIAEQNSGTVLCIDGIMGVVFCSQGVKTTSTMSIIEYLYMKKLISYDQYYKAKIKLIKLNCHHIPLSAKDLEYAIENRNYCEFLLLIETFKNNVFAIESVALVFAEFIARINRNENLNLIDKMNSIRDILYLSCNVYFGYSFLSKISMYLLYDYLHFKNEIQYVFNKILIELDGDIFIEEFIKAISKYLDKEENIQVLENKKDFYIDKIILNLPFYIRDKITKEIYSSSKK